jgi:hypothetical protein
VPRCGCKKIQVKGKVLYSSMLHDMDERKRGQARAMSTALHGARVRRGNRKHHAAGRTRDVLLKVADVADAESVPESRHSAVYYR